MSSWSFNEKSRRETPESRRRQTSNVGIAHALAKALRDGTKQTSVRQIVCAPVRKCLWLNEEDPSDFDACCGALVTNIMRPYCDAHWKRAWVKPNQKRRVRCVVSGVHAQMQKRNAS